jgi:L-asparagine transporter-like permease
MIMRMLSEMAASSPQARSFTEYARAGLGNGAGFVTGWLYWYVWVMTVPIEAMPALQLDFKLSCVTLAVVIIAYGSLAASRRSR